MPFAPRSAQLPAGEAYTAPTTFASILTPLRNLAFRLASAVPSDERPEIVAVEVGGLHCRREVGATRRECPDVGFEATKCGANRCRSARA
jgi:hypothetical protein